MDAVPGPSSHNYFSQRLRLHYVDWGNHEAPPLLLIHGGRDHCRNWDWVARELRRDYHVIAPDLRGHGDSQWITGGTYTTLDYVYDIAQLVHQLGLAPLKIVAHSMGGNIALRYTGIYPGKVEKIVAIEGLGPSPKMLEEIRKRKVEENMRGWIGQMRKLSGRQTRRYPSLQEAAARMQDANPHLSSEQAWHLTLHGVNQNEDGTFSWKFDNYTHGFPSVGMSHEETQNILGNITCPTLLVYGAESNASNPQEDGRIGVFRNAQVKNVADAGHWVHHDQLEVFMGLLGEFL
ncbi:alpha/beta hydrolase [Halieaceae bacterium IMCC14734]|uniref:Alpha/beta hydrolase n=1 Tax=Candidatus Litorirhabdus singularis TaxID=2518993 RepID=A0ABT3TH30_9GAMM|nr:alpha/beta hydrolase [Candidatus Litorirhabdus singularis]MCX2981627.1 alpha/beta hydrolase [Candidatus Litorirhabdus singularis]